MAVCVWTYIISRNYFYHHYYPVFCNSHLEIPLLWKIDIKGFGAQKYAVI